MKDEINARLAAGVSIRDVSRYSGTTRSAVHRHAREHLPVGLVEAERTVALREAEEFLAALEGLHAVAAGALKKAKEVGDLRALAALVTASKGIIETAARLTGELRDVAAPAVTVVLRWGDEAEVPAAIEAKALPAGKSEGA